MLNAERRRTLYLLIPVILILVGYVLYPTFETFLESIRKNGVFSMQNYHDFFGAKASANFEALWNSVYISLLSVLFSALIGIPLAFIFTRYDFPGRQFFSNIAIMPIVLPSLVGVMAFMFFFCDDVVVPNELMYLYNLSDVALLVCGVFVLFDVNTHVIH